MLRKIVASALVLATIAGASLATTGSAEARYWHRGYGGYGYHHGGYGGSLAGGLAAGLVGGVLLGGVLASHDRYYDDGPVYYDEPRPIYGCHIERRSVPNEYDPGWHVERMRVCD
ncbi:hypothetical protein [Labrys monachus]|uniref:Uncharacterized protein n=1 Tax=Labrys monachus TaxID=217067 RepID=A0ABU0FEX4_9HYPH|nr:hypothetical protein [Labrys monachus]MDQ0393163.1 hypothetical protein [Labrys monachus]